MRSRPGGGALALVGLATLVLAGLGLSVHQGPWGDQAVIALSTARAAHLRQLLGPYSRFGWDHPGPLYFYLLALPFRLAGYRQSGLVAGSVLLSGCAGLATVAMAGSLGGRRLARVGAVVVVAEMAALGASTLAEVWNPVAIILPVGTYLVAGAGLALGRRWAPPAVVTVGTFLVQTDLSTVVLVGGVGLVALAATRYQGFRAAPSSRGHRRRDWAVAGAVGLALWIPPLVQQLTTRRGNLSALVGFARSSPPGQTWRSALRAAAGALWPPLRGHLQTGGPGPALSVAVVVALLGAALVIVVVGRRLHRPEAVALGGLAGVAGVAGVVSAHQVTGPLFAYLVEWLSATWVALGLAAAALVRPVPRGRAGPSGGRWMAAAAVVALAVLGGLDRPAPTPGGVQVEALYGQLRPALARAGGADRPVAVDVGDPSAWPWAAGLLAELSLTAHPLRAQPEWLYLFGDQFRPQPGPRPLVLSVYRSPTRASRGPAPGRLVAHRDDLRVYLSGP